MLRLPRDKLRIDGTELPLSIVYEDADVLVVDKPAGIAVHLRRARGAHAADAVVYHYKNRATPSASARLTGLTGIQAGFCLPQRIRTPQTC